MENPIVSYFISRYLYGIDYVIIYDVEAWPGVGEGIFCVGVEYSYVSFTKYISCNAAKFWMLNPEWAVQCTVLWPGAGE